MAQRQAGWGQRRGDACRCNLQDAAVSVIRHEKITGSVQSYASNQVWDQATGADDGSEAAASGYFHDVVAGVITHIHVTGSIQRNLKGVGCNHVAGADYAAESRR